MASLLKQLTLQPVATLSRKNENARAENTLAGTKLDSKLYFASGSKNNVHSMKLNFHQILDSTSWLEQDFITTFLRQHADTSILRSISLTSSSCVFMDPFSLASSPFQQIDNGNGGIAMNDDVSIQMELSAISTQIAADMLALSIRTNLPFKLIQREYMRYQRRKRMQPTFKSMQNYKVLIRQLKILNGFKPPAIERGSCLTGRTNGLPNYNSTCFLNSVLQALASATPFVRFLERIVVLDDALDEIRGDQRRSHVGITGGSMSGIFGKKQPLSRLLLHVLQYVNKQDGHMQRSEVHKTIRLILDRLASEKEQFKSYRHHYSKEQQDAQELLQALITIIVEESHLEEDDAQEGENDTDESSEAVNCDRDFGDSSLFTLEDLYDEASTPLAMMHLSRPTSVPVKSAEVNLADRQMEALQSKHYHQDREQEEKKQEASCMKEGIRTEKDGISHHEAVQTNVDPCVTEAKKSTLSTSMQMMVKYLSSKTPSPLSGCFGSKLQCCECRHVKPIHDSSFLEIPVVPTMISKPMRADPMRPCYLEECLNEFSEVERVEGVNCRACSIKAELEDLNEEMSMLEDAMSSLSGKGSDEKGISALKYEWNEMKVRYDFLKKIDPDEEIMNDANEEEASDFDTQHFTIPEPVKVDHEKNLLVTRFPPILCLHVKRLHYNANYQMLKCNQHIEFPEYLDMSKLYAGCDEYKSQMDTISKDTISQKLEQKRILYRLISVIEHRGNAFSGHYVTYRRVVDQALQQPLPGAPGTWVYISDETTHQISWEDVRQCNAYMLIYEAI